MNSRLIIIAERTTDEEGKTAYRLAAVPSFFLSPAVAVHLGCVEVVEYPQAGKLHYDVASVYADAEAMYSGPNWDWDGQSIEVNEDGQTVSAGTREENVTVIDLTYKGGCLTEDAWGRQIINPTEQRKGELK